MFDNSNSQTRMNQINAIESTKTDDNIKEYLCVLYYIRTYANGSCVMPLSIFVLRQFVFPILKYLQNHTFSDSRR